MAAETFHLVSSHGLTWLECSAFSEMPWLLHAFGTRQGGAFGPKSAARGPAPDTGAANSRDGRKLRRFVQALGAARFPLAALRQTHSAVIYRVSPGPGDAPPRYQLAGNPVSPAARAPHTLEGDGLMAGHPGILLGVRTADCVPILVVDPERRVVAAVHAGWRGARSRIAEKAAGEMRRMFGSEPRHLLAAVGPSIRSCCYEVGPEVEDAFCGAFPIGETFFHKVAATPEERRMALRYQTLFSLQAPPGHGADDSLAKAHLDLPAAVRYQLEHAGVPSDQIYVADYCTACRTDLFYSYRKQGSLAGRMWAVIGMRPAEKGGASTLQSTHAQSFCLE